MTQHWFPRTWFPRSPVGTHTEVECWHDAYARVEAQVCIPTRERGNEVVRLWCFWFPRSSVPWKGINGNP
jgi:hypothetical protein